MFENSPGKPFILVGCKADLRDDSTVRNNEVSQEKIVPYTQVRLSAIHNRGGFFLLVF